MSNYYGHYKQAAGGYYEQGRNAGHQLMRDLSDYTQHPRDSAEFQQWQKARGMSNQQVMALGDIHRHLYGQVSNPDNFGKDGTPPNMAQAFTPQDEQAIQQYYAPQGAAGAAVPFVRAMGSSLQRAGNAVAGYGWLSPNLRSAGNGLQAMGQGIQANIANSRNQFVQGMQAGANYDNPYRQQLMARGATSYMQNRIGNYFNGSMTGGFGKGIGNLLKWLLDLISRAPGYSSIINPIIQRMAPNFSAALGSRPQQQAALPAPNAS